MRIRKLIRYTVFFFAIYGALHFITSNFDTEPYFLEIKVKEGDSLWSIAQEYKDQHRWSTKQFVKQIADTNIIPHDRIYPGQVLKIPVKKETYIAFGGVNNEH